MLKNIYDFNKKGCVKIGTPCGRTQGIERSEDLNPLRYVVRI